MCVMDMFVNGKMIQILSILVKNKDRKTFYSLVIKLGTSVTYREC